MFIKLTATTDAGHTLVIEYKLDEELLHNCDFPGMIVRKELFIVTNEFTKGICSWAENYKKEKDL